METAVILFDRPIVWFVGVAMEEWAWFFVTESVTWIDLESGFA